MKMTEKIIVSEGKKMERVEFRRTEKVALYVRRWIITIVTWQVSQREPDGPWVTDILVIINILRI